MNEKLIFQGGEPDITIRNTQYNPIADRAALFGVVKGLAGVNDVIVSGAAVTVNALVDASVTAGYIWLNGEILQVDAATVLETQGTDLWEFQKAITYDAAWDKVFNDLIPRQTYQQNRAILVNVAAIVGMDAVNALSITETLAELQSASVAEIAAGTLNNKVVTPLGLATADLSDDGWVTGSLINGWTGEAKYRLKNGYLEIYYAVVDTAVSANVFLDLPDAFAPDYDYVLAIGYNSTLTFPILLDIDKISGLVNILNKRDNGSTYSGYVKIKRLKP